MVDGAGAMPIPEAMITGSTPWVDPIDGRRARVTPSR